MLEPTEAEIVRAIFELAERGETPSVIARILSAKGLERRNGEHWTARQVAAILAHASFHKDGALRYGNVTGQNRDFVLLRTEGTV
jgi:recombinase